MIQAIHYSEIGEYIKQNYELMNKVNANERELIKTLQQFKNGKEVDFGQATNSLLKWTQKVILDYKT